MEKSRELEKQFLDKYLSFLDLKNPEIDEMTDEEVEEREDADYELDVLLEEVADSYSKNLLEFLSKESYDVGEDIEYSEISYFDTDFIKYFIEDKAIFLSKKKEREESEAKN